VALYKMQGQLGAVCLHIFKDELFCSFKNTVFSFEGILFAIYFVTETSIVNYQLGNMGDDAGPMDEELAKGMATVVEERNNSQSTGTVKIKEIDELPEHDGKFSNPMSRRVTFGEVSDYFVRNSSFSSA
jgi:hypothetical protein